MVRAQRPLSPFWVYRWQITMWLSSLHRITGLLLSAGAMALAAWLIALAGGAEDYARVHEFYSSAWFKVLLVGWTVCFFFHLFNGIRHLVWDTGRGFEPRTFRLSGLLVIAATLIAGIAFSFAAII